VVGEAPTIDHHDHDHDHHHHGHDHPHDHSAGPRPADDSGARTRGLRIALTLSAFFLVAEVLGGFAANSLALLADAGHLLTDVAALALSLFVMWFSRQPETPEKTYGYLRWEILAALLNGASLLAISVWIIAEAVLRLRHPQPIEGGIMLVVAAASVAVNLGSAFALHGGAHAGHGHSNLNLRAAYLHVVGDLLASIGTVVAALIVRYTGWLLADPIASIAMTVLIARGSWRLVRESVDVLLEATPRHISTESVRKQLIAIPGIESVHDLHIWTLTSGMIAMSAHALVREPERHQHVLEHVHDAMRLFGIDHVTIQLERDGMDTRERHLHA
jgi:cobalt-zinc-cadmium efflux system protein